MFNLQRFKDLCKERGQKQADLFRLVGRSKYYSSDIAKGTRVPIEYVQTWADSLGTTTAYLLGETDKKNKPTAEAMDFQWFINLSPENKAKVMERAQVLLEEQEQKK